ncbi:type I-E CRISPR-associated protein Cas5/CasD [Pseudactinotalea sp. Z1732]|uniref:type I-E CRISPR-associated protein Cas5/CasD n=1 Tax=Micrococcales TaxID=85006 RepID=UPI003C7E41C1
MSTLLLRLAGPMQSWGTRSRFSYRFTDSQPSKSAILGLLAAAQGRRRSEPIEDLLHLRFGVRLDQPGRVIRDFQTARSLDGSRAMPLTQRYYLSDAVYVAGVEGPQELIDSLSLAVRRPEYPLYLGRRSCPPARSVHIGVREMGVADALASTEEEVGAPWEAALWWRRRQPVEVDLEIVRDVLPGEATTELVPDAPLSFDPHHRRYAMRPVLHAVCSVRNHEGRPRMKGRYLTTHDPFEMTGS